MHLPYVVLRYVFFKKYFQFIIYFIPYTSIICFLSLYIFLFFSYPNKGDTMEKENKATRHNQKIACKVTSCNHYCDGDTCSLSQICVNTCEEDNATKENTVCDNYECE